MANGQKHNIEAEAEQLKKSNLLLRLLLEVQDAERILRGKRRGVLKNSVTFLLHLAATILNALQSHARKLGPMLQDNASRIAAALTLSTSRSSF